MYTRTLTAAALAAAAATFAPLGHAQDTGDKPKQSVGEYASDAMITTKVKAAIVAEPAISALEIAVETNDGIVRLSGTVDTAAQSDAATRVARGVDGVKQVTNEIKVRAP